MKRRFDLRSICVHLRQNFPKKLLTDREFYTKNFVVCDNKLVLSTTRAPFYPLFSS